MVKFISLGRKYICRILGWLFLFLFIFTVNLYYLIPISCLVISLVFTILDELTRFNDKNEKGSLIDCLLFLLII